MTIEERIKAMEADNHRSTCRPGIQAERSMKQ